MKRACLAVSIIFLLSGLSHATLLQWVSPANPDPIASPLYWETPANWSYSTVPFSEFSAWFTRDSLAVDQTCSVTLQNDTTVANVAIDGMGTNYSFDGNSSTLNVTGRFVAAGRVQMGAFGRIGPGVVINGNVSIPYAGDSISSSAGYRLIGLEMTSPSNIVPGKSVFIGSTPGNSTLPVSRRTPLSTGMLILDAAPGLGAPSISPNSTGTIALYGEQNEPLTTVGNCFLGSYFNIAVYHAPTLPAGTDGVYRFGGTGFQGWDAGQNAGNNQQLQIGWIGTFLFNIVTGDHDVLIWNGGARFQNPNDYTGTTTVSHNLRSDFSYSMFAGNMNYADAQGRVNPFGSDTGAVVLQMAAMQLENTYTRLTDDFVVNKGALSFEGQNVLIINKWPDLPYYPICYLRPDHPGEYLTPELDLVFASATRVNKGVLTVGYLQDNGLDPSIGLGIADAVSGKAARIKVTAGVPTANGMAAPYYIACGAEAGKVANFVNYTTADGFVKILDSQMTALSSVVASPTGGTGTEIAIASTNTQITRNVNVYALKIVAGAGLGTGNTVTVGSGGVIMDAGAWPQQMPNWKAGSSGTGEMLFYVTGISSPTAPTGQWLCGRIAAGTIVKAGPGGLWLDSDNTSTFSGRTHINSGILYSNDVALGGTASSPGGAVVLNGGTWACYGTRVNGLYDIVYKNVVVGPVGGELGDARRTTVTYMYGSISEDTALGAAGPLTIAAPMVIRAPINTTGGIVIGGNTDMAASLNSGPVTVNFGRTLNISSTTDLSVGRLTLLGSGDQFTYGVGSGGLTAATNFGIGSLAGTGDIRTGTNLGTGGWMVAGATLTVGGDNTDSDYFGKIYEPLVQFNTGVGFVKVGTGTQTLWGDNAWWGQTIVESGTLRLEGGILNRAYGQNNGGLVAGEVIVGPGATLDGAGVIERDVVIYPDASMTGNLKINGYVLNVGTVTGGTVNGDMAVGVSGYPGLVNGPMHVMGNVLLSKGSISGREIIDGQLAVEEGSFVAEPGTLLSSVILQATTGESGSFSGSSTISGEVQVVEGSFSGQHNIMGTFVQQGGLVSGESTFGTPATPASVTLEGGTFSGNHTIYGNVTAMGAVFAPGNGTGTISVVGNVSFDSDSVLVWDLTAPGVGDMNDLLTVTGDLVLNGTLNINPLGAMACGRYRLMNFSGTVMDDGLTVSQPDTGYYDYSLVVDQAAGHVDLEVVPEPTTITLLASGIVALVRRRRTQQ